MGGSDDILPRKADHVEIVLAGGGAQSEVESGLDGVRFEHAALPELHVSDVSLATEFLGRRLAAPFLISSMTGGFARGASINLRLAEAAERHGIAFAVGSQRIAIEQGASVGLDRSIRRLAPSVPVYANLGAAQLVLGYGIDEARRAVDLVEADALIIHLNPLQESVQRNGDQNWRGVLAAIEGVVAALSRPVIVKEVGFGISGRIAKQLAEVGVAAVDVAGAGGTNWALVEGARAADPEAAAVAAAFAGWGIPTATALRDVRAACPDLPLIGSGGIRNGVDAAKAIRLGADLVGMAAGLLAPAAQSAEAIDAALRVVVGQLRIACFCTRSRTLADLRRAPLLAT